MESTGGGAAHDAYYNGLAGPLQSEAKEKCHKIQRAKIHILARWRTSVFAFFGGADELAEERMRPVGAGLELRMELHAHEPRVLRHLDNFD